MAHPLKVCFVPSDTLNPYQRELASHLELNGVSVTTRRSLRGLVGRLCRGAEKPDVIHLHWLPRVQFGGLALAKLALFLVRLRLVRLLGCRIVWTVHNLHHHEATHPWAERWLARRVIASASWFIVHSASAVRLVSEAFDIRDRTTISVVPHGTLIGAYANSMSAKEARGRLQLDPAAVVLLFFGHIRPYKGIPAMIDAYQRQENTASALVIAGKAQPAVLSEIERSIADDPRIRLKSGFVPDADVQLYMNASDVVVLPYQDVLTSGAVVLAMSFGRACIAPSIGCIPDLLDERGAFLYEPDDPDGLREAIGRAMRSRAQLMEMGAYNRERTKEWGWDRVARETAAVYASALGRPDASAPELTT